MLSQAADTGAALAGESDNAAPQPAAATPREVIEKLAASKVSLRIYQVMASVPCDWWLSVVEMRMAFRWSY